MDQLETWWEVPAGSEWPALQHLAWNSYHSLPRAAELVQWNQPFFTRDLAQVEE